MSVVAAVGLVFMMLVHTVLSAIGTRFFRVRMNTSWGAAIYAATVIPAVLLVSMIFFSGVLGLGGFVGGLDTTLLLVVILPLSLGVAIDLFWVPAPDEVEVPDTT